MDQVLSGLSEQRKTLAYLEDRWFMAGGWDKMRYVDPETLRAGYVVGT